MGPVQNVSENSPPMASLLHKPTQLEAKRRKVRKGTFSCWECKRRKMKCIFDSTSNTICSPCRRRSSECISQEYPEEIGRYVRARGLQKANIGVSNSGSNDKSSEDNMQMSEGILTPLSTGSGHPHYLNYYESFKTHTLEHNTDTDRAGPPRFGLGVDVSASHDKYDALSRFLHEALPSQQDLEKLCKTNRYNCVLAHEALTVPFTVLDQKGLKTSESLLDIPDKNSHPVLIALYMIQLAVFLQYLPPNIHDEVGGLSELPRSMMERLANLATRLVITNDELLGSIEGLECVMIEGLYQANLGNLRRSWVTGRRALGIAQLMGLNRSDNRAQFKVLDPKTKFDPQFMWFRINFLDRYLCLLLGVSQGCLDRSMASDNLIAKDTPMERLDRIHCVIASRILERNESSLSADDLALTRALDMELQKAARVVPSTWWLAPNLDSRETGSQGLYWDTRRLISQVFHYNLLNQLHLPYMLHHKSAGHKHEYSRITCVNASREVLSRFIALRSFNKLAYSCRTVDFLALMSAMTLLLAHLASNPSETENLLAHQYHSDRAMIEQAQKNMMEVNRLSSDALSAQSADLLRKLLAIDVESADGSAPSPGRVSVQPAEHKPAQDSDLIASVHVPYFGSIKILREGMARQVYAEADTTQFHRPRRSQAMRRNGTTNPGPSSVDLYQDFSGDAEPTGLSILEDTTRNNMDDHRAEVALNPAQEAALAYEATQPSLRVSSDTTPGEVYLSSGNEVYEPVLQYGGYHEIAAGGEDWAFQGVDMAFFDSLMRSTGDAASKITE